MDELLTCVPANRAVLCENCQMITEARGTTCPSCGSAAITSLARFLATGTFKLDLQDTIKAGR